MLNVICNVYYYIKKTTTTKTSKFVFAISILCIVRYILSIYAKILQPLNMHGSSGRKRLCC